MRLTRRQADVLAYLAAYARARGYPPTVREIEAALGVRRFAVQGHLAALARKGAIARDGGARAIRLLRAPAVPLLTVKEIRERLRWTTS